MSDPMEPAQNLMKKFAEAIEGIGMQVHTFAVLPSADGPPHVVQAMLVFDGAELDELNKPDGDAALSPEEADIFAQLERDIKRSDDEEKAQEAAEGLKGLLDSLEGGDSKGIFGDEDDDE